MILWDTTNPTASIRIATARIDSAAAAGTVLFGRDGRTLVIHGSYMALEGTTTLWSYDKLNSLRTTPATFACAATGRGLTAAEWARYIPELPYRRTCAN
jgi:hypothetical protein